MPKDSGQPNMDVCGHCRPQQAGEREVMVVPEEVIVVVALQAFWDAEHLEPQVEPILQQLVLDESVGLMMQLVVVVLESMG